MKKLVTNNRRLSEIVKEQLTDWIMDGTLKVGQKISEDELAERLGVSRMPVREALRLMESMGLVESTPFVGSVIRKFSPEEIAEIYMLRGLLEPTACYHAAQKITLDRIYELEMIQKTMDGLEQMPGDFKKGKRLYQLNRDFHFKIYDAAELPKLLSIIENLWENTAYIRIKSAADPGYLDQQRKEHYLYLKFLREQDSDSFQAVFNENLTKHMNKLFQEEC